MEMNTWPKKYTSMQDKTQ